MPLIDTAQPDALAQLCAELKRYSLLLTVGPPRIHGAASRLTPSPYSDRATGPIANALFCRR